MAFPLLTADDIRFRKFTPVRFREGYDPDEVDDFLEEVISTVEELTRIAQQATLSGSFPNVANSSPTEINNNPVVLGLRAEVNSLKEQLSNASAAAAQTGLNQAVNPDSQKLFEDNKELVKRLQSAEAEISRLKASGESGSGQAAVEELKTLQSNLNNMSADFERVKQENSDLELRLKTLRETGGTESGKVEALTIELEQVRKQLDESNSHIARLQVKLQNQESTNTGSFAAIGAAASSSNSSTGQAAAMLNMAQQLHDEYVQKGKNEKAKIEEEAITEKEQYIQAGKDENARLIEEGRSERERIISEAKQAADETYESLAKERTNIEKKIDELRLFEKDYRQRLKKTLEGLLDEVKSKAPIESDSKEKDD